MNRGVKQNTLSFCQANVTDSSAKSLQQMTLPGIFILLQHMWVVRQQFVHSLLSVTSPGESALAKDTHCPEPFVKKCSTSIGRENLKPGEIGYFKFHLLSENIKPKL